MTMLTKEQLMQAAARPPQDTVSLSDELDADTFEVRGLTGKERDTFGAMVDEADSAELLRFRRRMVLTCMMNGELPMFSEDEVDRLADTVSAIVIERGWETVKSLSGIGEDNLEDIAGN